MSFSWSCGPEDFKGMGATARIGIGLPKPKPGEDRVDVAVRAIEESKGPVLARYIANKLSPGKELTILDFGSGPAAMQTRALRELDYNVTAFEWEPAPGDTSKRAQDYHQSIEEGIIDPNALDYTYDIIYASNVINVQPTWGCFWTTLNTIAASMAPHTVFLCNLASEPRRIWDRGRAGDLQLEALLQVAFDDVVRAEKSVPKTTDYVWRNRYWRGMDDAMELEVILDMIEAGHLTHRGGL